MSSIGDCLPLDLSQPTERVGEQSVDERQSTIGEEDFYIVVWRDGSYIIADGRLRANEYEQDEDWLTTLSLNEMIAKALLDKGHVSITYSAGATNDND